MRRRRKSVRNVDDHRRGSIMARISRFYYFNAGPDRRGPRDSHTHSPILAWESFSFTAAVPFSLSLSSFATLRSKIDRFAGTLWAPCEIRILWNIVQHPPPSLTKLSIFQYFGSIIEYSSWKLWTCTYFWYTVYDILSYVSFTILLLTKAINYTDLIDRNKNIWRIKSFFLSFRAADHKI